MKRLGTSFRRYRLALLLGLLGLIGLEALHLHRLETAAEDADAPRQRLAPLNGQAVSTVANSQKGEPPAVDAEIKDIFAVRTWEPPKPVIKTKPLPPPPPQAPPIPFRILGKIADNDKNPTFLLLKGERVLSVRVGDTIDDTYLIEKYEGGQLHLRYQPLNIHQTLFVGTDP
jgi:hypothetical protein